MAFSWAVAGPVRCGRVVSRKGAKVDRNDFENLKSKYYELRGWDVESGLPTESKLRELGLEDAVLVRPSFAEDGEFVLQAH